MEQRIKTTQKGEHGTKKQNTVHLHLHPVLWHGGIAEYSVALATGSTRTLLVDRTLLLVGIVPT